jgi:HSP20 family protein
MLIRWRNNSFPALPSMFDDFFNNDLTSFFGRDMSEFFNRNQNLIMPAVNIKESQDAFQIEVAAPGLRKEDFKLNLDHNVLTVSVQRESRREFEQPQAQSQTGEQSQTNDQGNNLSAATTEGQSSEQTNSDSQGSNQNIGMTQASGGQSLAMQVSSQNQPQRYTRREFSYTSFQRSFTLPETVEPEQISANYQDGILTINVPKRQQNQGNASRTIDIS